jgi:hypothetical protein
MIKWRNISPGAIWPSEGNALNPSEALIPNFELPVMTWISVGDYKKKDGHWDFIHPRWFGTIGGIRFELIGDNNGAMDEPKRYWKKSGHKNTMRPAILPGMAACMDEDPRLCHPGVHPEFIKGYGDVPPSNSCTRPILQLPCHC